MPGFLLWAISPIGRLVVTAALMFSLGAIGGWRVNSKLNDAEKFRALTAAYQIRVKTLENQAKQINAAAAKDQARALAAESLRAQAENKANALQSQILDGVCLSGDDADKLRQLWPGAGAKHPAAGNSR